MDGTSFRRRSTSSSRGADQLRDATPRYPVDPRNPVRKPANFSSSAPPPRGDVTTIFGRNRRLHQPCAPFTLSLSYCTVTAYNDTESPVDSTVSESIEKRLINGIPQVSPVTPLGIAILRKLPDLGTFDDLRCCRVSLPIIRDRTYIRQDRKKLILEASKSFCDETELTSFRVRFSRTLCPRRALSVRDAR